MAAAFLIRVHQNPLVAGLCPDPLGELKCSSYPLAALNKCIYKT